MLYEIDFRELSMVEKITPKGNGESTPMVVFDFIKSQHFRVIHADGAIGSVVPTGHLHMALYSERRAIPQRMAFKITEGGELGEVIASETVAREGMVREIEVDVLMNLRTAEALRDWLTQRVDELRGAFVAKADLSPEKKQE